MEDENPGLSRNSEIASVIHGKKVPGKSLVASRPKAFSGGAYRLISSLSYQGKGSDIVGNAAFFLLKVAALEAIRRFSKAKCPFVWRGVQALQLLCYPPLKWIQRWAPIRGLIKTMQTLSRPWYSQLLLNSLIRKSLLRTTQECTIGSQSYSDVILDTVNVQSVPDSECIESIGPNMNLKVERQIDCNEMTPIRGSEQWKQGWVYEGCSRPLGFEKIIESICHEGPQVTSENWLLRLHKELENQGISLPSRVNDDELSRFYVAANGDFSCLLSSVKKTIRWRDAYRILTEEELKMWSNILFWHGFDVKDRPCLVVRLGQACLSLLSHDRPRFAQAVISQVEYGVLRLVDAKTSQITVLVDCEGLPTYKIPVHMMRYCFSLLQDHYPNRLGYLFVIRLPGVVRFVTQTLIQVLRPSTREKLRIEGETYLKVLYEYLQALPAYLGGNCHCEKCRNYGDYATVSLSDGSSRSYPMANINNEGSHGYALSHMIYDSATETEATFSQVVRTCVIFVLMLWLLVALITGFYDRDSSPF
ncbi:hypothetical protein SAY86_008212 [Trapa natans]|uniref:CRAL-TRIO domain-containing protein n=1 Tax=Trapa natans TaxID=22666 RepID=A0AAN7K946_TRANT|nr:hypothetical protein SAY86_008212 [Trapa natans]